MPRLQYQTPINNTNVNRNEQLCARGWYIVLLIGFIVGCLALLYWIFMAGAAWGPRSSAAPARRPAAARQTPPVVATRQTPTTRPPLGRPAAPATSTITVNVPGLQEAANALKTASERLSAQTTPTPQPSRLEVSGQINLNNVDREAPGRRPLGQRPPPASPCADSSPGERGRCEAWLKATQQ